MRRALVVPLVLVAACSGAHPAPGAPSRRVVYRVVDDAGAVTVTTVDVAPPYRARVVTRTVDGAVTGGFAWDERGLYGLSARGAVQTAAVAPGFPGPFSGLAIALPVAEQQHLVRRAGADRVLDRPCVLWVSAEPLDGAPLSAAGSDESTTSCVDAGGVLLREQWRVRGTVVRTRTATFVGDGPSLAGTALLGAHPTPLPSTGGYVVRPASAAELARLLQVPVPAGPAGSRPDEAVAVLDPSAGGQGFTRESAVFIWLHGDVPAVLRLERDLSGTSKATVRGAAVDLGALGTGHLEPVLAGLRVVVDGPRGLRATATADLPAAELLAWVRTLRWG